MAGSQESWLRAFFDNSAHIGTSASTSTSTSSLCKEIRPAFQNIEEGLTCMPPPPSMPQATTKVKLQCADSMSPRTLCSVLSYINNIPGGPSALRSTLQSFNLDPGPRKPSHGHPHWPQSTLDPADARSPCGDLGSGDFPTPTQLNGSVAVVATPSLSEQQTDMAKAGGCAILETSLRQSTPTSGSSSGSASRGAIIPIEAAEPSTGTETPNKSTVEVASDCPVLKPFHDGHHWRRYGRKQIKGAEHPRLYYKCMDETCDAKKQMQLVVSHVTGDGTQWVTAVTYENEHHKGCTSKERHQHKVSGALEGTLPRAKERKPQPRRTLDSRLRTVEAERLEMRKVVAAAPRSDWAKALLGFRETGAGLVGKKGELGIGTRDLCEITQAQPLCSDGRFVAEEIQKVSNVKRQDLPAKVQEVFRVKRKAEDAKDGESGGESAFALKSIRLFGQDVKAF